MRLPKNPLIYEIHTAAWLTRLSDYARQDITLANIPEDELSKLAQLGINIVWLMGVWSRSPAAASIDAANYPLQDSFQAALPDFTASDAIGSAYAVRDYTVDERFGGPAALAELRRRLSERGIGLMLDFVPNHTALDHSWVSTHPDSYIRGNEQDTIADSVNFVRLEHGIFAKGRDPHFDAWPDALQVNAFSEQYRQLALATLTDIASQCDGVRCDMAMLMLNRIFADTWGNRAGPPLADDFWTPIIQAIKQLHPDFVFLAESYWDTEAELIDQGFDYCYDKPLYDHLIAGNGSAVKDRLKATDQLRPHLASFIENHDEQRAAAILKPEQVKAATALTCTLPGMRFLHDGQLEGYKTKIPVQLGRGPIEATDKDSLTYYKNLLGFLDQWELRDKNWQLRESETPEIICYEWTGGTSLTVRINYSPKPSGDMAPWEVRLLPGEHGSLVGQ